MNQAQDICISQNGSQGVWLYLFLQKSPDLFCHWEILTSCYKYLKYILYWFLFLGLKSKVLSKSLAFKYYFSNNSFFFSVQKG